MLNSRRKNCRRILEPRPCRASTNSHPRYPAVLSPPPPPLPAASFTLHLAPSRETDCLGPQKADRPTDWAVVFFAAKNTRARRNTENICGARNRKMAANLFRAERGTNTAAAERKREGARGIPICRAREKGGAFTDRDRRIIGDSLFLLAPFPHPL